MEALGEQEVTVELVEMSAAPTPGPVERVAMVVEAVMVDMVEEVVVAAVGPLMGSILTTWGLPLLTTAIQAATIRSRPLGMVEQAERVEALTATQVEMVQQGQRPTVQSDREFANADQD